MRKKKNDFEEIFLRCDAKKKPLKTLLLLFQDNLFRYFMSVVFFVIKNLPVWILPLITSAIINEAMNPRPETLRNILIYFGIGAVVVIQNVPSQQCETYFTSRAVRDIEMRLRASLVRKLQHLTISFHKNLSSGRIQSKILRDVDNIEALSKTMVTNVTQSILNILVFAAITLLHSPLVALFFLLTIPVAAFLIRGFRGNISRTVSDFRKEIEHMSAGVSEMVEMIPVTKAHGLERIETKRINTRLHEVQEKAVRTDTIQTLFGSSSFVAFQTFQLACLCFTGILAYKGKISVGEIALFQSYFNQLLGNVSGLLTLYPTISKGFESLGSISEILASDDIENNRGKKRVTEVNGAFVFDRVGFTYPDDPSVHVLNDFSLTVKQGEYIAFVGESGSGKTTALNLLIGFHFPTEGTLTVDGRDIRDINLTAYRRHIAVVSQTNILFSGSIRDNIAYGLSHVTDEEINRVIDLANLRELVDELPDGIHTQIGERGGRLSGGQKQRIAIARAMIRDPQIILLDEATSALDNVSEHKVQEAMDKLIHGRTTFVVAHRLSTIRNADRIVVMKNGKCVEIGTYDALMENKGYFYTLAKLQEK
ncbi:MAG: ABC transporter ATP-binding protein [Ruminococcaceae bacterium]|nr:ABC transporter ATP-binding protein [Oscillospiraceae bacterium]